MADGLTGLVFAVAFLGGVIILVSRVGSEPHADPTFRAKWEDLSRRLGGRLLVKESEYQIRLRWNGAGAFLSDGDPAKFTIPDAGFEGISFILSELPAGLRNVPGRETVPGFYLVGSGVATPTEFFTPGVLKILEELRALGRVTQVEIDREFRVIASPGRESDQLARFVSLSLRLAQHARVFAGRDAGVTILEESRSDSGLCQICGADLERDLVACARCSTRHHRDCWEYTGVCSTYGCGERSATET